MGLGFMKKSGLGGIVFIIILVILVIGYISGKASEESEKDAFRNQMNKDPSTWTQTEQKRYNDFMDWSSKN